MLLLASKYTDIPACYSEWFFNRLSEGYFLKENKKEKCYEKINLTPKDIDCIIFSTKNPQPMIPYLNQLNAMGYNYCFRFTLTPYGNDFDRNLGNKRNVLKTFENLCNLIGPERISWHYGPILLNDKYTLEWHKKSFKQLLNRLCVNECNISFDAIPCTSVYYELPDEFNMYKIADEFKEIAESKGVILQNCSKNFKTSNVKTVGYIDYEKINKILPFNIVNDRNVIDCGEPFTCTNDCVYCKYNSIKCKYNNQENNQFSPLLIGFPDKNRKIKKIHIHSSVTDEQVSLFS